MGFAMNQNRMAIPAWSYAMEVLRPKTVIELGTNEGGMSVPLAICCQNFGARFITFDLGDFAAKWKWWFNALDVDFRKHDIFASIDEISNLIQFAGTTFVLCDNGEKIKEFKAFAPFLKKGDVIGARGSNKRPSGYL